MNSYDDLENCAFCGAGKQHFRAHPKTKHYQLGNTRMVTVNLDVNQCLKCETRWIKYREIKKAVE